MISTQGNRQEVTVHLVALYTIWSSDQNDKFMLLCYSAPQLIIIGRYVEVNELQSLLNANFV